MRVCDYVFDRRFEIHGAESSESKIAAVLRIRTARTHITFAVFSYNYPAYIIFLVNFSNPTYRVDCIIGFDFHFYAVKSCLRYFFSSIDIAGELFWCFLR